MTRTHHYNGLKTAVLLGGMWSLLLLIGYALARGTGSSIWLIIAPVIGLAQTAFGFWNSDKIAVRSMGRHRGHRGPAAPDVRHCA